MAAILGTLALLFIALTLISGQHLTTTKGRAKNGTILMTTTSSILAIALIVLTMTHS